METALGAAAFPGRPTLVRRMTAGIEYRTEEARPGQGRAQALSLGRGCKHAVESLDLGDISRANVLTKLVMASDQRFFDRNDGIPEFDQTLPIPRG